MFKIEAYDKGEDIIMWNPFIVCNITKNYHYHFFNTGYKFSISYILNFITDKEQNVESWSIIVILFHGSKL